MAVQWYNSYAQQQFQRVISHVKQNVKSSESKLRVTKSIVYSAYLHALLIIILCKVYL